MLYIYLFCYIYICSPSPAGLKKVTVAKKPNNMAKSTGRLTDIAAHALALEKHELYNRLVLLVCIYCSSKTL